MRATYKASEKYYFLTLLKRSGKNNNGATWLCRCDCGTEMLLNPWRIRSGHTKSCGCKTKELISKAVTKHGAIYTSEYKSWSEAKNRCRNPNYVDYKTWGGRGIRMCARWLESFENFYADMGPKPSSKYSIDRIDNDGDYEPGNCRWATSSEQMSNKSNNVKVLFLGESITSAEAMRRLKLSPAALCHRVKRKRITHQEAINHYIMERRP